MQEQVPIALFSQLEFLPLESDEYKQFLEQIHAAVHSRSLTILTIVEKMGEILTNTDPFIRAKGAHVLASVINSSGSSASTGVGKANGSVLLNFLLDRMYDKPSVPYILDALTGLVQGEAILKVDLLEIPKRMFAELTVQSFQHTVRYTALRLLDLVLENNLDGLVKTMNNEFLFGYIQALDGEKDPRNLMLAFKTIAVLAAKFDCSRYAEDLFDVFYCYFPITFKPPPNDPHGITADDLKTALKNCIAANPAFSSFAMPLLLEKLTSTSNNAKRDAMDALATALPVYGFATAITHQSSLWINLKDEVLNPSDERCETAALASIKSLTACLGSAPTPPGASVSPLQSFLEGAVEACLGNLKTPGVKLAKPSGRLLVEIASASPLSFAHVIDQTVSVLLDIFKTDTMITSKRTIMDILVKYVSAGRKLYGSIATSAPVSQEKDKMDDDDESPLLAYKDRLFELFGSSVSPAVSDFIPLTMVAIQGLLEMLLSSNLLAGQEMYTAVQIIQSVILLDGSSSKLKLDENVSKNTKDQQTLYKFATEALRQYSVLRTEVILETSIPVLFENLPVSLPYSSAISDQRLQADLPLLLEKSKRILMTVRELCAEHKIFEACIPLLVEKLENACSSTAFSEADSSSLAEAYCVVLLDGLLSAFKKQGVSGTFSKSSLLESATLFLIKASARACLSASSVAQVGLMGQRASLDIVGKLLTFLIRHMDTSSRDKIVKLIFEAFVDNKFQAVLDADMIVIHSPLSPTCVSYAAELSLLFASVICSCPKQQIMPCNDVSQIVLQMVQVAKEAQSPTLSLNVAKVVASLINKLTNDNTLENLLSDPIITSLVDQQQEEERMKKCILLHVWITKSLVLRCHPIGYELTSKLISIMLSSNISGDVSKQAAEGFDTILSESSDGVLTKESFADVKVLYKQRFFSKVKSTLLDEYQKASSECKHLFLIAISNLIRNIPKQLLLGELNKLFPILVNSVSFPDPKLKLSAIDTFLLILTESPSVIEEHISTVIPVLVGLADFTKLDLGNTLSVRIKALELLGFLTTALRYEILHPHKANLIRLLATNLDDPKRIVRSVAANTRNKYYLLPGPKQ